jgi:DNA mismatch repair protein MutS2
MTDSKTLALLDYYRVRDSIAGFCAGEEGRAALAAREPLTDPGAIEALKTEGREWTAYLTSGAPVAMTGWPPVQGVLQTLKAGGAALSLQDALALRLFCGAAESLQGAVRGAQQELSLPALAALAQGIPCLTEPASLISAVIDSQGQLRNLPELRALRGEIARLASGIESSIKKYAADNQALLQSPAPALRGGRQTLAVKAQHKRKIPGILHEASQTGQTVYIEPEELVRKNNDLADAGFRLEREIRRIMRELTERLAAFREDFLAAWGILLRLEGSLAAARWGISVRGVFAETGPLVLAGARHPLLGDKAVPIDLSFAQGRRILIITGPNTGGKTAALKTAALAALLNQSGFPVPAALGTALPVFSRVFADIGDAQSLDDSLSTFSAHMQKIASILAAADSESLALLDELGSGTDPEEGGALAFAILDALIEKKALALVTTHHGALKNYAYSHRECENASVEFDSASLSPTYRIVTGVPGESRALQIARKSDLPPAVVDAAEAYLAGKHTDISALIRGLTEGYAEAERVTAVLQNRAADMAAKERKLEEKAARIREREEALAETERRDARLFLNASRKELENLVRRLREGEITREKTRSVKQFIRDLEQGVDATALPAAGTPVLPEETDGTSAAEAETPGIVAGKGAAAFVSGGEALLRPKNTPVTLVRQDKGGGEKSWIVQAGSLKLRALEKDLAPAPKRKAGTAPDPPPLFALDYGEPVFELRLLGMRQEEAVKALERQLDLAAVRGLRQFTIIHGKGNGVLQQVVRDYLSAYPGVQEFHFAKPEEGGTGKTWVALGE